MPRPLSRPLLVILLVLALALGAAHAAPSAAPLGPDSSSVVHRFPPPAGASWNSGGPCYDAVATPSYEDGAGARYWGCYTRAGGTAGMRVVRTDAQGSVLVDIGIVPSARGELGVNPRTCMLELTFFDIGGPGYVAVPGWVVPAQCLQGRAALPLISQD